jgi:hypothetical protein
MEVALRRRLEGVADIAISQSRQTVNVKLAPGPHTFSPEVFRKAVDEAGVEVIAFTIDACGTVEPEGDRRWFVAGKNRFLLAGKTPVTDDEPLCVNGRLDDKSTPPQLEVSTATPQSQTNAR